MADGTAASLEILGEKIASPKSPTVLERMVITAWERSRVLRGMVAREMFDLALRDASKVFRQYPNLQALVLAYPQNRLVQGILHVYILLHARSKDPDDPTKQLTRKYSHSPVFHHSLRVAEDVLEVVKGIITNPDRLAKLAIKAIGHDLIEDFKTSLEDLITLFNMGIATSINKMTTPRMHILTLTYPAVTKDYVSPERMQSMSSQEYLRLLKQENPAGFKILKSSLKQTFKSEVARNFLGLDEYLIKGVDNSDYFHSNMVDIIKGDMGLYPTHKLGAEAIKLANGKTLYPTSRAEIDFQDRTVYHNHSIIRMLIPTYEDKKDPDIKSVADMREIQERLDTLFIERRALMLRLVAAAKQKPTFADTAREILNRSAQIFGWPPRAHFIPLNQPMIARAPL